MTRSWPRGTTSGISDDVKIRILKILRKYPILTLKNQNGCKFRSDDWLKFSKEVHRKTGNAINPSVLSRCVSSMKFTLQRKLKICIVDQKMGKDEVEKSMQSWKFYRHFAYYRKEIKQMEEKFWKDAGEVVPDGIKEIVLKSIKDRPIIRLKAERGGSWRLPEWEKLSQDVFRKTGENVKPYVLAKFAKRVRKTMWENLKKFILLQKLSLEEMENALARWRYYEVAKYYRDDMAREEARLWKIQAGRRGSSTDMEMDDAEDDDKENVVVVDPKVQAKEDAEEQDRRNKLPLAYVLSSNSRLRLPRALIADKFHAEEPPQCKEAIRAKKFGSAHFARKYPGIPVTKFTEGDEEKYGSEETTEWVVQSVFEHKTQPGTWHTYFEGWLLSYQFDHNYLKATASDSLKAGAIRAAFLQKIKDTSPKWVGNLADKWRFNDNWRVAGSMFWDFEDMTYFHSKIHAEYGLGLLFYIALTKEDVFPKKYAYTPINIMDISIYNVCRKSAANTPYTALASKHPTIRRKENKKGGCENPTGCVCNHRFALLYGGIDEPRNLETTPKGLLDLSKFSIEDTRIAMECTDACGCSHNCPRRQTQKGNPKPLVVYYEGPGKEFGLRAAASYKKGEYIGDYTGRLKIPHDKDNHSYEAGMKVMSKSLVVCSRKEGNFARFMSHSCDPNSIFVEVWSKKFETDPWLPKISVYAAKDIAMGEEISTSYWTKTDLIGVPRNTPCLCHTSKCIKMLP